MVKSRYPRKNKTGNYPIGPANPIHREWTTYQKEGGKLGYKNYIEANKRLDKENRRK
jgi:hypothetical protein